MRKIWMGVAALLTAAGLVVGVSAESERVCWTAYRCSDQQGHSCEMTLDSGQL